MSLYVRVNCNFYTHRKTAKLRALIGDDALWLPPRWWAYAAENQPDGIFKDYTAPEIATLLGYQKEPIKMLEALLQVGFADADPLRIHDWQDYNAYHLAYSARAKNAATVRWQRERSKEKETELRRAEKRQALLGASSQVESQDSKVSEFPQPRDYGQLLADEHTFQELLTSECESCNPDKDLIKQLELALHQTRDEMKKFPR